MITELRLMQNCYTWFHNSYPYLRGLLFKVKNEGVNRITGNRDKATGTVPGVSDMIFLSPIGALFLEFKTETGRQSPVQVKWQKKVEEAGYRYFIIRSEETFKELICHYV